MMMPSVMLPDVIEKDAAVRRIGPISVSGHARIRLDVAGGTPLARRLGSI